MYNDVDRLIRYEDDKDTMSKIYLQTMDGISPLKNKSSFSCNPIEGNKGIAVVLKVKETFSRGYF